MGPGKGRKFLEIGCGSGALYTRIITWLECSCLRHKSVCCSCNKRKYGKDLQAGTIKEGGIGPDGFPFEDKFDLIIWNLPYIPADEVDELLGPMEEAGLIDTDTQGLQSRFIFS